MGSTTMIICLLIGLAAFAGIYYLFQSLQQEKLRINALSLHLRKIEGMLWAYNIKHHTAGGGEEEEHTDEDDDEDDEDETNSGESESEGESGGVPDVPTFEPRVLESPVPPQHPDLHLVAPESIPVFAMLANIAGPTVLLSASEVISDLPTVDSFDAFNAASRVSLVTEIEEPDDDANVEVKLTSSDADLDEGVGTAQHSTEITEITEIKETEVPNDPEELSSAGPNVRVYADNATNRRLGRVGKPIR